MLQDSNHEDVGVCANIHTRAVSAPVKRTVIVQQMWYKPTLHFNTFAMGHHLFVLLPGGWNHQWYMHDCATDY